MLGIIAGTPVDTTFGLELFEDTHKKTIGRAVSKTPAEQTFFQLLPNEQKISRIEAILQDFKTQGISQVLVYCNSLSASVDFKALAKALDLFILTPLDFYQDLAKEYRTVGLLTANAQGSAGIERVMTQANPNCRVQSVSSLDWVFGIEQGLPAGNLLATKGLLTSIQLFEQLSVEAIIFGCTHFSYFLEAYQSQTSISCLSPDSYFLQQLV